MDMWHYVALCVIPMVVAWVVGKFKRLFRRRNVAPAVVVRCPYCKAQIGLERLRNYICGSCSAAVAFFTTPSSTTPRPEITSYACTGCGVSNFEGVLTCLECGHVSEMD